MKIGLDSSVRRRTFFRCCVAFAVAQACDDLDNIDVSANAQVTIAKKTVLDDILASLPFSGFDGITFDEQFANQGVTKDDVDSVHVKSFTLSVDSPAEGNFDFIERIDFFAAAPGVAQVRIASAAAIPAGARSVDLTLDDVELLPYVTAASMTISADVQGQRPDVETTVSATIVLDVDIRLPGC